MLRVYLNSALVFLLEYTQNLRYFIIFKGKWLMGFIFLCRDNFLLYYKYHYLFIFFLIIIPFLWIIYIAYIHLSLLVLIFTWKIASFNMLVMNSGLKVHFMQLSEIVPVEWPRVRINFFQIYFNFDFVVLPVTPIFFSFWETLEELMREWKQWQKWENKRH